MTTTAFIDTLITEEQVTAAYEARHQAFVTNADNKYALADRAMALNLRFESQKAAQAAAMTTAKKGRPAKHADAAARQKAWREANKVKTLRLDGKIAPTVAELAEMFDTTETHVVNNLLRFALASRNWKGLGIGGWAIKDARFTNGKCPAPAERDDSLDAFSLA